MGAFLLAAGVEKRTRVVVVSASMGGTFAAPFVANPQGYTVAGYVTVAGSLPAGLAGPPLSGRGPTGSATAAAWGRSPRELPPLLCIFGSEDPRLLSDRAR